MLLPLSIIDYATTLVLSSTFAWAAWAARAVKVIFTRVILESGRFHLMDTRKNSYCL